MGLTVKQIEALPVKGKLYRVLDADGLYIEVAPSGSRLWRFRYRFGGKGKMLALGKFPDVPLKRARELRDDAKQVLRLGLDPAKQRRPPQGDGEAPTFEQVAREWVEAFSNEWAAKTTATRRGRLELHVFPYIGGMPISAITAQDMLRLVQRIQARGAVDMARRVRALCSQVFRYGVPLGVVDRDPAADVRGVLPPQGKTLRHHAALTSPGQVGALMRSIDEFQGSLVVRLALQTVAYTFVRSSELRRATWDEVDLKRKEWRIPAERMKARRPHVVPLARQVVAILEQARELRRGSPEYVFPGLRVASQPLSENTLNAALRRLGYSKEEMTTHGFRSTASTLLYENGWPEDAVERQLAHIEENQVRAAYDHAKFMKKRREMMQWYADHLDALKARR